LKKKCLPIAKLLPVQYEAKMVVKFYKRVKEKRAGVESRIIDSLASKSAYTY